MKPRRRSTKDWVCLRAPSCLPPEPPIEPLLTIYFPQSWAPEQEREWMANRGIKSDPYKGPFLCYYGPPMRTRLDYWPPRTPVPDYQI